MRYILITLLLVAGCAQNTEPKLRVVDGDILFYRQGTGQADWAQPVINASLGYVYLGFAVEPEESTHTADAVICWDRKGNKVWQFNLPDGHRANGGFTMNSAETHLYIGTDTRHANSKNPTAVYCLDAATGVQIWKTDAKKGFPKDVARINSGGALSPDETVLYIGAGGEVFEGESNDNRFFALDSATGKVLWIYTASHDDREQRPDLQALPDSATAGNGFWADPAVGPDGTIYAPCFNGILYAFNPDGVIKWKYESFYYDNGNIRSSAPSIWHEIWGGPALNADASVVYVGSNDWFLHAVDTATGKALWKFEACFNCSSTTETGEIYVNPIVGPDGAIYFDSEDNYTYAVNSDGTLKWRSSAKFDALTGNDEFVEDHDEQELAFLGSFMMLDDGTLIAGVDTGRHYLALDASDGSLKWISKIVVPWAPRKRTVEIRTEVAIDPVTNNIYGGTGSLGGLVVIEGSSPLNKTAPWPKTQKDNHCSGTFVRNVCRPSMLHVETLD